MEDQGKKAHSLEFAKYLMEEYPLTILSTSQLEIKYNEWLKRRNGIIAIRKASDIK